MERQIERGGGLDVHRDTVAACVRVPGVRGERAQHVRTFGTTAAELLRLRDWLEAHAVTHVAMESTGVYWKPVFYVLEDAFTCLLVNAAHIKQVPGRKTDVLDCIWIAQLLEHGLLRGSFVPPVAIRELRDLTRHRKVLIQERQRVANRLHKLLQDAGIKLASVATDILGVSGRAMLEALVQGTTDPDVLADLARGKLRKKLAALRQVLSGRFRPHHAFLVSQLLAHVDYLDEAITTVSAEVDAHLAPFASQLTQLDTVHGIARRTAEVIHAEIGVDMSRLCSPMAAPSSGRPSMRPVGRSTSAIRGRNHATRGPMASSCRAAARYDPAGALARGLPSALLHQSHRAAAQPGRLHAVLQLPAAASGLSSPRPHPGRALLGRRPGMTACRSLGSSQCLHHSGSGQPRRCAQMESMASPCIHRHLDEWPPRRAARCPV
jgi:transposase